MAATILSAQTVNVHFKNGQTIRFNSSNVEFVDFSEKAPDPTLSAGSVVDLGLSVYWASCNLGAEKPEEYGNYYAWGETEPKENYTWGTYKWCNGSETSFTKYNTESYLGAVDNVTVLALEDDAAHVKLGGSWRMPTMDELKELLSQCTWAWITQDDVQGIKFTGPNGNSIFLPAAGYREGINLRYVESYGYYGCSSLHSAYPPNLTSSLYFYNSSAYATGGRTYRCDGLPVRPVSD